MSGAQRREIVERQGNTQSKAVTQTIFSLPKKPRRQVPAFNAHATIPAEPAEAGGTTRGTAAFFPRLNPAGLSRGFRVF